MTFEEWWNDLQDADWKRTLLPGEEGKQRPTYWGENFKRHAFSAWNAATLAEREACAAREDAQNAAERLSVAARTE